MTETEQKALALVRDVADGYEDVSIHHVHNAKALRSALCRAIEQHEAFRQEVSDALSVYQKADGVEERSRIWDALTRFIIAKPDPLVEAMQEWWDADGYADIETFRAAIEKRGGKIVWGEKQ